MFFSIKEMLLAKARFHETYAPGAIELSDQRLRQSSVLEADGVGEVSAATLEIRIRGHLKVRMEAECDRCLETAAFPIDTDFELVYRPDRASNPHEEIEIDGAEAEVGFYEGDGLALADVIREQVLLSLPMQRVCREDCKGICPVCGQNRNVAACDCHAAAADDRWAQLRNL